MYMNWHGFRSLILYYRFPNDMEVPPTIVLVSLGCISGRLANLIRSHSVSLMKVGESKWMLSTAAASMSLKTESRVSSQCLSTSSLTLTRTIDVDDAHFEFRCE